MRPLRLAVWGLGRHAVKNILPAVSATDGLELHGVCSRNENTVSSCAERWNCKTWTDPTPMLLDPDLDIIFVATPIGLHFEHGTQVIDANKHFWCEKPLTCRLQDTLELLELSRRKGVSVCEGHMYLYHPQFRRLFEYVHDGSLGPIVSISCRFGIPRLEQNTFRNDPALGGGALFDVGCYPVSAIQALFPEERMDVSYSAVVTRDGSAVDTDGHAIIALSNGATAHLEWRINCAYRNEIDIWGENNSVFTDKVFSKPANYIPAFRLRNTQGIETIENGVAGDHFSLMLKDFLGSVSDAGRSEKERGRIARRAEVLDQISRRANTSEHRC
jgi:NDP-hexose-3-ketoreductase